MAENETNQAEQQPLSVEERLATLEQRLTAIETHSHTIPIETVNEIAAHIVNLLNEQIRTAVGQTAK